MDPSAGEGLGLTRHTKLVLAACGVSIVVVGSAYAAIVARLPSRNVHEALVGQRGFILWQALGFLAVLLASAAAKARLRGVLVLAYLGASSVGLIACTRSLGLAVAFGAFAVWAVLAALTFRLVLRHAAGPHLATWGIAATSVFAILIPIAFLLGVLGLVLPVVVWALAGAMALPGLASLLLRKRTGRHAWPRLAQLGPTGLASVEVVWLVLAIAFVWANVPETASDSSRVYLPFARDVAFAHGFEVQRIDWHRLMPMAMQSVSAVALAVGGPKLATWLSWAALVALAVLVGEEIASRSRSRTFGVWSAAAVLTCPLLGWLAGTIYVDHVLVLLAVGAFVALTRSLARDSRRGVVAAALVAGVLAQVKYTAVILAAAWALALMVGAWRRRALRAGFLWCAPALIALVVATSPWYGYVTATTGDPVFPFAKRWFPSAYWPAEVSTTLGQEQFERPHTVAGWLQFPWKATFHTSAISTDPDGYLGFWLLALFPLALAGRPQRGASSFAFAGFLLFATLAPSSVNARYWLPAHVLLLFWLLAMGSSLMRRTSRREIPLAAGSAGVIGAFLLVLPIPLWLASRPAPYSFPWDVFTRSTSERSRLLELLPGYGAIDELNQRVKPSERVLFSGSFGQHLVAARTYEFPAWFTSISRVAGASDLRRFLHHEQVRYWLVDYADADDVAQFRWLSVESDSWHPSRLRAAFSTIAVYEVGGGLDRSTIADVAVRPLPPAWETPHAGVASPSDGWARAGQTAATVSSAMSPEQISLAAGSSVFHTIDAADRSDRCRVTLRLNASGEASLLLTLDWRDEAGKTIQVIRAPETWNGGEGPFEAVLFAPVPPRARFGYLGLWTEASLGLGKGVVEYWLNLPDLRAGAGPLLEKLDPARTVAGHGFNVQPTGLSALAIRGRFDSTHTLQVVMDGHVLPGVGVGSGLVTALVPPGACATPGIYEVLVVDTAVGERSNSLVLTVDKGNALVPPALWRQRIPIDLLYPEAAIAGGTFNVQASGASALAIGGVYRAGAQYSVVFDGRLLPAQTNGVDLVSAVILAELLARPGEHEVFVIDSVAMERSNSLFFALRQATPPAGAR